MRRSFAPLACTLLELRDVPAAPNILVSFGESSFPYIQKVVEYTPAGVVVGSPSEVPPNGGADQGFHDARDIVRGPDGQWIVYNGTFSPNLALLSGGGWSTSTADQWSTANNITYGGLTTYGQYVFAPDMNTGGGEAKGIVRFDLSTPGSPGTRVVSDQEYIDLNMGRDGKLYALQSTGGRIDVFNPATMVKERFFFPGGGQFFSEVSDVRGVAADSSGTVYVVSWGETVHKLASNGTILASIDIPGPGGGPPLFGDTHDIDVSADGQHLVIGSRFGTVIQMTTALTDLSYFQASEDTVFVGFNETGYLPPPPPPGLVGNASLKEGHSGQSMMRFTVSLGYASALPVTMHYATTDGTAVAGADYVTTEGDLSFLPGETQKTIDVPINGDREIEPNETFTLTLSNAVNATVESPTAIGTIRDDDAPPAANAGPDRTGFEGMSIRFTGRASVSENLPLTYAWNFGDGTSGTGIAVNHAYADNGTYTATLTVTDSEGNFATDETTVTITNRAPTGSIHGPTTVNVNVPMAFQLIGNDPGPADRASLQLSVDWGDGTSSLSTGTSSSVLHAYSLPGTYIMRYRVMDKDGASSPPYLRVVNVRAASGPPGAVFVSGTPGDDSILVSVNGARLDVRLNGQLLGTFAATSVTVLGLGGNDTIATIGRVPARITFDGGTGNDLLNASSASGTSLLIGGDGDDVLRGGLGRDILIGGAGVDSLDGGSGEDLLTGGDLTFSSDVVGRESIRTGWLRSSTYESRRDQLLGSGAFRISANTIVNDGAIDTIVGGLQRDWSIGSSANPDSLIDRVANETWSQL